NSYVLLLNHAIDGNWAQEGIYISFNENLDNPLGWSAPERLPIDQQLGFYPQVIGLESRETDKLASRVARLFIEGHSSWEIVFHRTLAVPSRPQPKEKREIIRAPVP